MFRFRRLPTRLSFSHKMTCCIQRAELKPSQKSTAETIMTSTVQRVIAVGGARGVLRGVATTRHQPMWWRSVACAALPQAGRRRCSGAAPIGGHGRFTHTTTRSPSQQQQQPQAAAATADFFTAKQHADSPPGIFGVPALHTPDDFDVLAHKVIEECKQLLRAVNSSAVQACPHNTPVITHSSTPLLAACHSRTWPDNSATGEHIVVDRLCVVAVVEVY